MGAPTGWTMRPPRALLAAALVISLGVLGVPAPASASLIGQLSGTVTGDGAPLPNVWVTLTPVTEQGDPDGTPKRALTDESGMYEFPEIYVRNVTVHARAPLFGDLVDTYWPDAHSPAQAGIIEISTWPLTADIDLPVGGSVSGRVVDLGTGAPVQGVVVSATIAAAPSSGTVGVSDQADGPGAFALSGLPPGEVLLHVRLPPGSSYLSTPFRADGSTGAGRIEGGRDSTGVVLGLRRGGEIRGTVRDAEGAPVADATVKVLGCFPDCPILTSTDESGAYRLLGIPSGSRLSVVAWRDDGLLKQWFPGRDNAFGANDIALEAGDVLDSVDFTLIRGAAVEVAVVGTDSGDPVTPALVQLTSTTDMFTRYVASGSPTAVGRMRVGPVPPGSYFLSIRPGSANPHYAPVSAVDRP